MDKRVVIFFSLLGLLMIGGSFALSLWVLPKYLPRDTEASRFEMVKPEPDTVVSGVERGPRNAKQVNWVLMSTKMMGIFCGVLFVGLRLKKRLALRKPLTAQGYIFKITQITGKSAHDVFYKAAQDWPVSKGQIEQDFKKYISNESIPYYVNDFIRKNKKHIDQIPVSIFQFNL